jgi:hypothetical protein
VPVSSRAIPSPPSRRRAGIVDTKDSFSARPVEAVPLVDDPGAVY